MAKIAISLPDEVFEVIEKEREATGESRSEFLRRAVETLIRKKKEQEEIERYIRGYQQYPETDEEIAFAKFASLQALAENPWEDDSDQ